MAVKILWYLTAPDGTIPWEPHGRWDTGFDHLQQLAATIDKLGYYGALLATGFGSNEVLTVASATLSVTKRMKFFGCDSSGAIVSSKTRPNCTNI